MSGFSHALVTRQIAWDSVFVCETKQVSQLGHSLLRASVLLALLVRMMGEETSSGHQMAFQ